MSFSSGELLVILQRDGRMKAVEILKQSGMPTRSQSQEKTRTSRRSLHHHRLRTLAREKLPSLPWSIEAENVIEDIAQATEQSSWTAINQRYQFLIDATKDKFEEIERAEKTSISLFDFSLVLVHYHYFTAMRLSKLGALCTGDVKERFDRAGAICRKLLDGRTETWAVILKHQVITRAFGVIWNDTPAESRDSQEMRALVERRNMFYHYDALNDLLPSNRGAPFNALSVASRFKERTRYDKLLRRLVRAAPEFKNPLDVKDDPYFDQDFDDFRLWVAERGDSWKEMI